MSGARQPDVHAREGDVHIVATLHIVDIQMLSTISNVVHISSPQGAQTCRMDTTGNNTQQR